MSASPPLSSPSLPLPPRSSCMHLLACTLHTRIQVANGWIPCLEFSEESYAYVANTNTVRFGPVSNVSRW